MNVKRTILAAALLLPCLAHGIHPLVSDDTDTQGAAGFQLELNTDTTRNEVEEKVSRTRQVNATLTYGLADTLDLALNLPYRRNAFAGAADEGGRGDAGIILKWRFFEKDGFSLGLKPHVLFATGDAPRGLGNGRMSYGANFLAALEADRLTLLANAGYTDNRNTIGERKDLWNLSAAMLWRVTTKTRLALDTGSYRSPNTAENRNPAFAILGAIYSPSPQVDLDVGLRRALNAAEPHRGWGMGITIRW